MFQSLLLKKQFDKLIINISEQELSLPDSVLEGYENWKNIHYLSSDEIEQVFIDSLDYYSKEFNNKFKEVESFQFFEIILDFYEKDSSKRHTKKALNFSEKMRFYRIILEEASLVKIKKQPISRRDFLKTVSDLYSIYRNMFFISNCITINRILDLSLFTIERHNHLNIIQVSSLYSVNYEVAQDIIEKYSSQEEKFMPYRSGEAFFNELNNIGLSDKLFNSEIKRLKKTTRKFLTDNEFYQFLSTVNPIFARIITGMILHPNMIKSLIERIRKPFSSARHLTYPIMIWNIDGKDIIVNKERAFLDAFSYIIIDLIPYGVIQEKWKKLFPKESLNVFKHGRDFELFVENLFIKNSIPFISQVSIKMQKNEKKPDFIIYDEINRKLIVADCKNLVRRNDPNGWLNDYYSFNSSQSSKSYNKWMDQILSSFENSYEQIKERFKNEQRISLPDKLKVEGLFITNTPTLYMFRSKYSIMPVGLFAEKIHSKSFDDSFYFENDRVGIKQSLRFFQKGNIPEIFFPKQSVY